MTTAMVMFNGGLYRGELLRETAKRILVKFTTGTGTTREGWFSKTTRPAGILVSRRAQLGPGQVTINANSGFILSDECPECSTIGNGSLCKAHRAPEVIVPAFPEGIDYDSLTSEEIDRRVAEAHARLYPNGCPGGCEACARRLGTWTSEPIATELPPPAADSMVIKILPNAMGSPAGKLADVELHFSAGDLVGFKLIGFSVWERRTGGGRNVTFPARSYSVNGERRSFALLRPTQEGLDGGAQDRLRDQILTAYEQFEQTQEVR